MTRTLLTFDRKSPECLQLLRFVSNELYLDGGTTLAPWLKEYAEYPKRINGFLLATVKTKRLLTFIELFPETFVVSREKDPHTIRLRTLEFCDKEILKRCMEEAKVSGDDHATTASCSTAEAVRAKAMYALRRRESRISRRKPSKQAHDNKKDHEASMSWLLSQCTMELHKHLRNTFFYPIAYETRESLQKNTLPNCFRVGEKAWSDLVLDSFRSLLDPHPDFRMLSNEKVAMVDSKSSNAKRITDDEIREMSSLLRDTILKDGATQVCLSLLLSRHDELRQLLCGRDLLKMMELNKEAFFGISAWKNDIGGVVLRLTEKTAPYNGRMQVDEEGLFSVASGRWGCAMSNIIAQEASAFINRRASDIVAVDLTASVGGLTLALSKRFQNVVAVEIDQERAYLCRENMKQHCRDNVRVLNVDAMEALEDLGLRSIAVAIDPPWGGHEYKRLKKPVAMGKWSLEHVISKIGQTVAPAVVGIRLPVNYCCTTIEESLTEKGVQYDILLRRKVGPQLLFVAAIHRFSNN